MKICILHSTYFFNTNDMTFKTCATVFIAVLISTVIYAQENAKKLQDSIISSSLHQLQIYPQEKIYTHLDKNFYISCEKMWFRAHLVNASTHIADSPSRYIYAELVNPTDSLISRVKIRPDDKGLFYGHVQLPEQLPEGYYVFRAYTAFMKNTGNDYFFRKTIRIGNPASAKIKSNIFYLKKDGDEILKIYLTDSNGKKIKPDRVDIRYNNERTKRLKLDSDSTGTLSYKSLFENSNPVLYLEFKNDGIFYSEFLNIPNREENFDVSFLPEGGNLPVGTTSKIAFKAIDKNGLSEEITGEIADNEGNILMQIKTTHLGMGVFSFVPSSEEKYYAVCRNKSGTERKFELPQASANTYSLQARFNREKLMVSVSKSIDITIPQPLYILVHCRGVIQSFNQWNYDNEYISIKRESLPGGIIQILMLDSELNTISERLVFNPPNNQPESMFTTDKKTYKPRQLVSGKLKFDNSDSAKINGNISVSVTNDSDIPSDTAMNIVSYLLLSSELKGHLESPFSYIKDDNSTLFKLDILMLTQGWRRYDIPAVIKGRYTYPEHPFERSQEISGLVKTGFIKTKGTKNNQVSLLSPDTGYFDITETDDKGNFHFQNIEFPDSTKFFIQALSQKGRKSVELFVDKENYPSINECAYIPCAKEKNIRNELQQNIFENYITKADRKYTEENGIRMINLPEVKVTSQKTDPISNSIYMSIGEKIFSQSDIEKVHSLESLFYRIPGVRVQKGMFGQLGIRFGRYTGSSLQLNTSALFIVDDIIMDIDFDPSIIPLQDIEEIGVLKGSDASILGSRGAGGAVYIKTKTGGENNSYKTEQFNVGTIVPLGYQTPVEFYSPKYETKEQINDSKPDLRSTVFWKPDVIISDNGEASFDFYTADTDKTTTYSIIMQGVTSEGQIIYKTDKITVGQ